MMPTTRAIDLDTLTARLAALPATLAGAQSLDLQERNARASLQARGIKLRGDKSTVGALIEYEMKHLLDRVEGADQWTEAVLASPVNGRPNAHPVVRDFLVFTQCCIERSERGSADDLRLTRKARQATARMFGLTCDTAVARSHRFSIEQVRRAEERTLDRFVLIHHLDHGSLLTEGLLWGVKFMVDCWVEARGGKTDAEEFEANARKLSLLCRVLDASQHARRLEKADARHATQALPKRKPR